MITAKKELIWFLIPTFCITYSLGVIAHCKGGLNHFPLMTISMFVPGIVVILLYLVRFRKPVFKHNDLGLRFQGFRFLFIGLTIPFLVIALSYIISYVLNNDFFMSRELILETTEKTAFGSGNWILNLVIIFTINISVAPVINILMFLGEEIGWRAFMLPRLLKLFNPMISFLIGGIVWGLWHGAGILMGFNYPGHPFIGIIMMILICIPMGVILQYIYYMSRSIFIAAISHGVMNWTASSFTDFIVSGEYYNSLIYGPTGIVGLLLFYIVAFYLFKRVDWKEIPIPKRA